MTTIFTTACIQLNTGNDLQLNIKKATTLISAAASVGADFITLPENSFFMGASKEETFANALPMEEHPAVLAMMELSAELKVWLLFGLAVADEPKQPANLPKRPDPAPKRLHNRCVLLNATGEIVNYYDKIHMFDVDIIGGESHRESDNFEPGDQAVLVDLPWAKLGMTICYDLRFPNLFRELAKAGAEIITVPSAFTHKTGEAHWHSLLRARAIETTAYIIAPAQCGHHPRGRQTYGHSIIISPWGEILAEASENNEEFITSKIDLMKLQDIRKSLPSLKHDRKFNIY